jgi:hypothetical protein
MANEKGRGGSKGWTGRELGKHREKGKGEKARRGGGKNGQ